MARSIAVGLGLMEFPFSSTDGFWRWVDLCEAGGVDSIWQTDRIVSRQPILECMTALAAIAGRTRRIKFGVNVVSLALRDPVLLAKQCATIDVLSQGRLLPGFGIGSPQGPEWQALHIDTATRGPQDGRMPGDHPSAVVRGVGRFRGTPFPPDRRIDLAEAGAARSADLDRRFIGGGGSAHRALRHRLAGGRRDAGGCRPGDRRHQGSAVAAAGRSIDEDHYGAAFAYRFGRWDDPGVAQVMEAYRRRTGRDPQRHFVIGDAATILDRIGEYVAADASKFILRPAARGDEEMLEQTRLLIEQVLPRVAQRWPRPAKAA